LLRYRPRTAATLQSLNALLHCAGIEEEEVVENVEEAARTPSIVAEAMSKSLPESRATSSGSSRRTSPAAENVEAATNAEEENLPEDTSDDDGTDQQVPVDDSPAEQPSDEVDEANNEATGQDEVEEEKEEKEDSIKDETEATEQVLRSAIS